MMIYLEGILVIITVVYYQYTFNILIIKRFISLSASEQMALTPVFLPPLGTRVEYTMFQQPQKGRSENSAKKVAI